MASPLGWHHRGFVPWQDTHAQSHGRPHALLCRSPACPCFSWAPFGPKSQLIYTELIHGGFSPTSPIAVGCCVEERWAWSHSAITDVVPGEGEMAVGCAPFGPIHPHRSQQAKGQAGPAASLHGCPPRHCCRSWGRCRSPKHTLMAPHSSRAGSAPAASAAVSRPQPPHRFQVKPPQGQRSVRESLCFLGH